jgi:transposase InsO family protein
MDSKPSVEAGKAVSCDSIGPLPKSPNGNQYALVVVDDYTRFLEIYPIREASSKTVVDKCVKYCCRYGWPESVRTDNGTQFTSKLWMDVCEKVGIRAMKTVSYRPKGNPTERHNRTIKQCINSYVSSHRDWDKHISSIAFAIRSSPSDTTSFTPAALTFGRELRQPTDISENIDEDTNTASIFTPEEYVKELQQRLARANKIARERCEAAHER